MLKIGQDDIPAELAEFLPRIPGKPVFNDFFFTVHRFLRPPGFIFAGMADQPGPLNFPAFSFSVRDAGQSKQIFDFVRKRYVALTPEEWVRQHLLRFLHETYRYPASLMAVEKAVNVNGLTQRADVVVYNREGKPWMIAECKAPSVALSRDTFYQAARYNLSLQVPFFLMTNGEDHFCIEYTGNDLVFRETLPLFPS